MNNHNNEQNINRRNTESLLYKVYLNGPYFDLIVEYLTIREVIALKACTKLFKIVIETQKKIERQCYARLYQLIIDTAMVETNTHDDNNHPIYANSISKTLNHIRRFYNERANALHCNYQCRLTNQTHYCINVFHFYRRCNVLIENVFLNRSLSITSRIMRYFHNPEYSIVYHSKDNINPYNLLHMNEHKMKYFLPTSFNLIKLTSRFEYKILKGNKNAFNKPYSLSPNWYHNFISSHHLQKIFMSIPEQQRNKYLITGYPLISNAIEQLIYKPQRRTVVIYAFAFNITYQQHIHNIACAAGGFIHENNPNMTFHQKNYKHKLNKHVKNRHIITYRQKKNTIEIRFIFTDTTTTINNIITSFGSSIEQFGITLDHTLHYSEAWLFTFTTKISYYFSFAFNRFLANHFPIIQYYYSNHKKWIVSKKISDQCNNDAVELFSSTDQHAITNLKTQLNIQLNMITKRDFRLHWDIDKIKLRFIQQIIATYKMHNQRTEEFRYRYSAEINDTILNEINNHLNNIIPNCICYV